MGKTCQGCTGTLTGYGMIRIFGGMDTTNLKDSRYFYVLDM